VADIGIAGTPEDLKVLIRGSGAKEGEEWSGMGNRLRGKAVEEIGGCVQGLSLVASRKRSLKRGGNIGGDTNHVIGSAILRGGVRARHPQLHTVRKV
jgi:hypothetical protein